MISEEGKLRTAIVVVLLAIWSGTAYSAFAQQSAPAQESAHQAPAARDAEDGVKVPLALDVVKVAQRGRERIEGSAKETSVEPGHRGCILTEAEAFQPER